VTQYRVPVSDDLLEQTPWRQVVGFRLIAVNGPWHGHKGISIVTFEDDNAPAELEGALVEPVLRHMPDGTVTVQSRTQLNEAGIPFTQTEGGD